MTTPSHRHWKCPKCGRKYIAALPIQGILCHPCTHKAGKPEQWMNPDNDHTPNRP